MERYELFLTELTNLCRKHDIEIMVNVHTEELCLARASDNKTDWPGYPTILDRPYTIKDSKTLDFGID